jgi:hypothetical protein
MVFHPQAGIEAKDGQGGYIPCTGNMLPIEKGASTALLIAFELNTVTEQLEQITAGVRMEGEKSVRERRLKMKEIDGDFIVFFVE